MNSYWKKTHHNLLYYSHKELSHLIVSVIASKVLGIPDILSLGKLFNLITKKQTGWLYDKYYGKWFYLNDSGTMKTGWQMVLFRT